MKYFVIIVVILFVFISCADRGKKDEKSIPQKTESQIENFEVFFDKFSSDSVFQSSRIKFPLPVETYDIDSEKFDKSTIAADKWTFFNIKELDKKKYILNTIKEKDQNIVKIQVEDTGVSVDYIFQKQEDKWMLIKIVDEST